MLQDRMPTTKSNIFLRDDEFFIKLWGNTMQTGRLVGMENARYDIVNYPRIKRR
jgi:hypothetical protein